MTDESQWNIRTWTPEEQRLHERALDILDAMSVECLARSREAADEASRTLWDQQSHAYYQERKGLSVHDHEQIARIIAEYGPQLRAWRAERGR